MTRDNTVHYLDDCILSFSVGEISVKVLEFNKTEYGSDSYDRINARNYYELHYVTGGNGTLVVENECYALKKGVFYAAGCGQIYRQISGGARLTDYTLIIHVDSLREQLPMFCIFKDFDDGGICFKRAECEFIEKKQNYGDAVKNCFRELIILLCRKCSLTNTNAAPLSQALKEDKYCMLTDIEFIMNFRDISLEKLSNVLGLSIRQCQRFLMENYNMSFTEKLLQARMLKAADYLVFTDKDIQHISEAVGYSGSSYFTRNFGRYFGMTPREYRKRFRNT